MRTAIITLSPKGLAIAEKLRAEMPGATLYAHASVSAPANATAFEKVVELTAEIFKKYEGFVYIMPCGVVVRAIAGCVEHKKTDPAVVVVDVGGRHAVSLLGGHEGGANALAMEVANILGAEPVISTTTEAEKTVIVGVGCRKGAEAEKIVEAITVALKDAGVAIDDVRFIASADVKAREAGLIDAAHTLNVPLRIIGSDTIRAFAGAFQKSDFVMEKVGLPAVAEPSAMLAGRRTTLLQSKKNYNGITVALARENCSWSA